MRRRPRTVGTLTSRRTATMARIDHDLWRRTSRAHGGSSNTLYAYDDGHSGRFMFVPGGQHVHVGPHAKVRMATRAEAERHFRKPLGTNWKVAP